MVHYPRQPKRARSTVGIRDVEKKTDLGHYRFETEARMITLARDEQQLGELEKPRRSEP